jgi:hypothetical protein
VTRDRASRVTFGLLLILFGGALLVRRLEVNWASDFGRLWPLVFFAIAFGQLLTGRWRDRLTKAAWYAFLGAIFIFHTYGIVSLRETWPLFIVAGGVSLIMEQVWGARGRSDAQAEKELR